jgi:hypothetical protein
MMPEWLVAVTTRVVMAIIAVLCFLFGCTHDPDGFARPRRGAGPGKLQGAAQRGVDAACRPSGAPCASEASTWAQR